MDANKARVILLTNLPKNMQPNQDPITGAASTPTAATAATAASVDSAAATTTVPAPKQDILNNNIQQGGSDNGAATSTATSAATSAATGYYPYNPYNPYYPYYCWVPPGGISGTPTTDTITTRKYITSLEEIVAGLKISNKTLTIKVNTQAQSISTVTNENSTLRAKLALAEEQSRKHASDKNEYIKKLEEAKMRNTELENALREETSITNNLETYLRKLESDLVCVKINTSEIDARAQELKTSVEEKDISISTLKATIKELENERTTLLQEMESQSPPMQTRGNKRRRCKDTKHN